VKKIKFFILVILLNLSTTTNSFAYIDPGMGSILIQSIIGAIAAGISIISIYWEKFKNFFKNLKKKKIESNKKK